MSNQSKKILEKFHFEYFKERCKELPSGKVDDGGEEPDFVIEYNGSKLGIEIVRLFKEDGHPNSLQALEQYQKQIVKRARELCEKDIPPLDVFIWFTPNQKVPKDRNSAIERISHDLAEYVKRWHQENPSKVADELEPHMEISELSLICIGRNSDRHYWSAPNCAIEEICSMERLQERINEKNAKYEEYLKRCNKCWLLIVVDIFRNSQSLVIEPNHRYESEFERVFCLDASHRKDLKELYIN